jgi:hypothetical protein
MRREPHDDEVCLKRGRHSIALGYSQRHMWITLIMVFYHRQTFRHVFYWPTTKDDAMEIITKCRDCQFFQKQTTKHANPLQSIDLFWPFIIWGIDIIGILPRAPGGFKFLFVAIDTFTKWMETMPAVNITHDAVIKFLQSIIYKFSVHKWILTDNMT